MKVTGQPGSLEDEMARLDEEIKRELHATRGAVNAAASGSIGVNQQQTSPHQQQQQPGQQGRSPQRANFNGVFLLLLLNCLAFVADHALKLPMVRSLYLHHMAPRWYQYVTATFCHASWSHLSSNIFFLYIFGRLVEEEEGPLGLWATYLITGAGANVVSWLLLPPSTISVGASGAVFGLFVVSVLTRLQWNWRRLLEAAILGQFVVDKVLSEAQSSAIVAGGGGAMSGVNHVAHLAGALLGVLLIWLISRIPDGPAAPHPAKPEAPNTSRVKPPPPEPGQS